MSNTKPVNIQEDLLDHFLAEFDRAHNSADSVRLFEDFLDKYESQNKLRIDFVRKGRALILKLKAERLKEI